MQNDTANLNARGVAAGNAEPPDQSPTGESRMDLIKVPQGMGVATIGDSRKVRTDEDQETDENRESSGLIHIGGSGFGSAVVGGNPQIQPAIGDDDDSTTPEQVGLPGSSSREEKQPYEDFVEFQNRIAEMKYYGTTVPVLAAVTVVSATVVYLVATTLYRKNGIESLMRLH